LSTASSHFDPHAAAPHPPELYDVAGTINNVPTVDAVTDEHIAEYHQLGFIGIESAFDAEQVAAARGGIADLIMGKTTDAGFDGVQFEAHIKDELDRMDASQRSDHVRKLMHFLDYEPRLRDIAFDAKLIDLITRLMGGRAPTMVQDMALLKPPRGREKPWHQDKAYFDYPTPMQVVGVWIALDDATIENGCMHLLPASHRDGPAIHFQRRDWQLCDTDVLGQQCVAAPLKPGGMLVFDGLLKHGTPSNHSSARRWAVQFHYGPEGIARVPQQQRLDVFGSEGKGVQC